MSTDEVLLAIKSDVAYSRAKLDGIADRLERVELECKTCVGTKIGLANHLSNHRIWNSLGIGAALAAVALMVKAVWNSLGFK